MKRVFLAIVLITMSCPGCASIMCTSEKTVNISSNPPGAKFEIISPRGNIVTTGLTPTNVTLKRGRGYFAAGDYSITFSKAGYYSETKPVPQGLETGWYIGGNFVFGGLLGWFLVDPLTGGMWDIKDINAVLIQNPNYKPPPKTKAIKQEKYQLKRNANGEIIKDENGNFVFFPVEGNEK